MQTSVILTLDGIVEHNLLTDTKMAEIIFEDLVNFYHGAGMSPGEMEDALDDGYFETDSGRVVCIGQPETDFNNDFLKSIREGAF